MKIIKKQESRDVLDEVHSVLSEELKSYANYDTPENF